jgi:hypothetical protein
MTNDEATLAKLAREVAMNVRPLKDIIADYGLSKAAYEQVEAIEFFKRAKDQFTLEWNSTLSTEDRLKFCSLASLELLMPKLTARAMSREEPLTSATEVSKTLMKISGIGEKDDHRRPSDRFVIQINLGAGQKGATVVEKYNRSIEANANDIDLSVKELAAQN